MLRRPLACALVTVTHIRSMHGKPTQSHKVRTQHSRRWWTQSKARHLTAMPHDECKSRPHFPSYNEDVDRPMVVPDEVMCFNCVKPINGSDINSYVWIPAGNATVPTSQGYFFHFECFKCWRCKCRSMHNMLYSKDGKVLCVSCALGRDLRVPSLRRPACVRQHSPHGVTFDRTLLCRATCHQMVFISDSTC
ncbi:unnamed protein product [Trypanosoma congolense IL3000]|uniref:WGS project CAEQ00000000 data, annotated contig 145 n=1 Tax=Trypanosoma congolense (strain IL3000) TaxID=1068625 RepID=F9W6F6_TRYCI|nr:unnamed protein product [Trypanosoma congolense IL3000]